MTCAQCKWIDKDWYYDETTKDEESVYYCTKIDRDFSDDDADWTPCAQFKRRPKPRPYEEKDTVCDSCERQDECSANGMLIEITTVADTRQHYIGSIGAFCPKGITNAY